MIVVFIVIKKVLNNSMKHWFRVSSGENKALLAKYFIFIVTIDICFWGGGGVFRVFYEVFRVFYEVFLVFWHWSGCSGVFGGIPVFHVPVFLELLHAMPMHNRLVSAFS